MLLSGFVLDRACKLRKMEDNSDDSFESMFDLDISYPNLTANFTYESPGFYQSQDEPQPQVSFQQPPEKRVSSFTGQRPTIRLPQHPLPPPQPQISASNINLLSFQPLPQGKNMCFDDKAF